MAGSGWREGPGHPDPLDLEASVDRDASPTLTLAVARHLERCVACSSTQTRIASLAMDLSSLPGAEVPEGFSARVMGRVRQMPPPRPTIPYLRLVTPLVIVAAGLATALAGSWTLQAARGARRLLPWGVAGADHVLHWVVALGAAALASLGRAAENLGPWTRLPTRLPGGWAAPEVPLALLSIALIGATLLVLGLAGRRFARPRGKGVSPAAPE